MARSFSGSQASSKVVATPTLSGFQYHLSFWVFVPSLPAGNAGFVFVGDRGVSNGFYTYITSAGVLHFVTTAHTDTATSGTLSTNTWYQILVTGDNAGATPNWVVYLNGSSVLSAGELLNAPANTLSISPDVACSIADVALWQGGGASTINSTVATNFYKGLVRPWNMPFNISPTFLVWLPLTGIQSPEPDLSGNANNGTVTGTTNALGPPLMQFTPRWPQFLVSPAVTGGLFLPTEPLTGMRVGGPFFGNPIG